MTEAWYSTDAHAAGTRRRKIILYFIYNVYVQVRGAAEEDTLFGRDALQRAQAKQQSTAYRCDSIFVAPLTCTIPCIP